MSGLRLAIPTGRSHVTIMNLLLKLAPALVILGLAAALVLMSADEASLQVMPL